MTVERWENTGSNSVFEALDEIFQCGVFQFRSFFNCNSKIFGCFDGFELSVMKFIWVHDRIFLASCSYHFTFIKIKLRGPYLIPTLQVYVGRPAKFLGLTGNLL